MKLSTTIPIPADVAYGNYTELLEKLNGYGQVSGDDGSRTIQFTWDTIEVQELDIHIEDWAANMAGLTESTRRQLVNYITLTRHWDDIVTDIRALGFEPGQLYQTASTSEGALRR